MRTSWISHRTTKVSISFGWTWSDGACEILKMAEPKRSSTLAAECWIWRYASRNGESDMNQAKNIAKSGDPTEKWMSSTFDWNIFEYYEKFGRWFIQQSAVNRFNCFLFIWRADITRSCGQSRTPLNDGCKSSKARMHGNRAKSHKFANNLNPSRAQECRLALVQK